MAGLSVVLEAQKNSSSINNKISQPQVINKTTMNTMMLSSSSTSTITITTNQPPSSSPFESSSTFLHHCFLCNKRLLPGKDIYMYKGDRGFCSVDCRCKQILTDDEEESIQKENCSLAVRNHRKGPTNQPDGVA